MKFIKRLYQVRTYFDICNSQTSWITGKLPEIASLGVILHFFGVGITKVTAVTAAILIFVLMTLTGYVLKRTGVYDTEQYVHAEINPVEREVLMAARKINDD